jgi:hypothetical protein
MPPPVGGSRECGFLRNRPALPGDAVIIRQHLGRTLKLAQCKCRFTITLRRIYADENKVVVGYTISHPDGHTFVDALGADPTSATFPVATIADGAHLQYLGGALSDGNGSQPDSAIAVFDGSTIRERSLTTLHLSFPVISVVERRTGAGQTALTCGTEYPYGSSGVPPGLDYRTLYRLDIHGPFTFQGTVPVTPSRHAELHRTMRVGGLALTLERVALSATETRLYVRGMPIAMEEHSHASLVIGDTAIAGGAEEISGQASATGWTAYGFSPISGHRGWHHEDWTVIVRAITGSRRVTRRRAVVSWFFRFTMPGADDRTRSATRRTGIAPLIQPAPLVAQHGNTYVTFLMGKTFEQMWRASSGQR